MAEGLRVLVHTELSQEEVRDMVAFCRERYEHFKSAADAALASMVEYEGMLE